MQIISFQRNCCLKSDDLCQRDMYIFLPKVVVKNGEVFRDKKKNWKKETVKYIRNILQAKVLMQFQKNGIYLKVQFIEY